MMGCPSGLSEGAVTDEGVGTGAGVSGMGAGGAVVGTTVIIGVVAGGLEAGISGVGAGGAVVGLSVMIGVVAGGLGATVSGVGAGGALVGTSGWPSLFSVIAVMVGGTGDADVAVDMLGTG